MGNTDQIKPHKHYYVIRRKNSVTESTACLTCLEPRTSKPQSKEARTSEDSDATK